LKRALAAIAATVVLGSAQAGSLTFCDHGTSFTPAQQDKLLRFGALVKTALDDTGSAVALVARSGLDLERFGQRFSHAGVSLKAAADSAWAVRQLYFACEDRQPRLFDQGMAAFVLGMNDASLGYVMLITLPPAAAAALERAALDKRLVLRLLGAHYSANAYPFSTRYQNCNQWLAELLAAAWGGAEQREAAQAWLQGEGYAPTLFKVDSTLLWWFGGFVPWLHDDDHPAADRTAQRYRVSMPASIESFVRQSLAGAQRIELCHSEHQAVLHRGWTSIAEGCVPAAGDEVMNLD
jgi:hypothetical protein